MASANRNACRSKGLIKTTTKNLYNSLMKAKLSNGSVYDVQTIWPHFRVQGHHQSKIGRLKAFWYCKQAFGTHCMQRFFL